MDNIFANRIEKLRALMGEKNIDLYVIVSDDFHASEYVGEYFQSRAYMSGFDGSAGTLIVTKEEALLWTDGRYFLQAEEQLKGTGIKMMKQFIPGEMTIDEYIEKFFQALEAGTIAYDGRTINGAQATKWRKLLKDQKVTFTEQVDLVGEIWKDRPALSCNPVWLLDEKYAGVTCAEKLEKIRAYMAEHQANAHLISSLDDIAWIYNLRGDDIAYNPVALAFSIIYEKKAVLYLNLSAVDEKVREKLQADNVELRPYLQIYEDLDWLEEGTTLLLDRNTVNVALLASIPDEVKILDCVNPSVLMKAKKNAIEQKNEAYAHVLDGVAVTKLIYWLKTMYLSEDFKAGKVNEISVAEKLLSLRKENDGFIEESFAPIIATGAHGAIVHYEATDKTSVPLEENNFVLMDTGGQYYYGTTDITRTVSLGELTQEQKENYTAVLRGHLNLGAAVFAKGCTGCHIDYLARNPLWERGLDYNHGTGHGVGYLLNVHEGPNRIRLKANGGLGTPFEEGMITSNEPGVYLTGKYGIRTENMILCKKYECDTSDDMLCFETLTLVPYERDAIVVAMLTDKERALLNAYHARVWTTIGPLLLENERKWLEEVCKPL